MRCNRVIAAGRRAASGGRPGPRSRTRSRSSRRARPRHWPASSRRRSRSRAIASSTTRGRRYAEFWLRKAVPATEKPAGPEGAVLFPVLAEGELLGALRFPGEGHDYRDQTIAKGVYTLRYGLQPVNGDHLGVSTYRDYALLVPAAKDKTVADLPQKRLEEQSAESAGTSHPAVLMLLAAPGGFDGRAGDGARRDAEHLGGRHSR